MIDGHIHIERGPYTLEWIKLFEHKPSYSLIEYYESLVRELAKSNMYADQNSGVERRCPEDVGYKIREMVENGNHCL